MRPYSHQAGSRSDRDAFVERGTDAPSSFDEAVIAAISSLEQRPLRRSANRLGSLEARGSALGHEGSGERAAVPTR
jgi:hypothetical protein